MPCQKWDSWARKKFVPVRLPHQRTGRWTKVHPEDCEAQQLQCYILYDSKLTLLFPAVNNDNGKYWSVGINIKSVFGPPAMFSDAWAILLINPGEFSNY